MQIWYFSDFTTVVVDILAWFIIHMSMAYSMTQLPAGIFNPDSRMFRAWKWEKDGLIYQKLFKIKSWKKLLPDGAAVFKKGFKKKRITNRDPDYLHRFMKETCRGEVVHWAVIAMAPVFFLWNTPKVGLIMIGYAVLANFPCIITQRFNRPFLRKLIAKQEKSTP